MINKRLLIKNLLAHNDENSFYDQKLKLSLDTKEGKAKFLKHVCALSNANPDNNSYIIIGVNDADNKIIGVDFFDDSKIQNLINAYLENPPKIQYENVPFPRLPRYKVIGLVTIEPNKAITFLKKTVWKYKKETTFLRIGSNSKPIEGKYLLKNSNKETVTSIEKNAKNNIELTLNGVFDFFNNHKKSYNPQYKVFNEQFVICWAGKTKKIDGTNYLSRVDIELVNEQVKLFFSSFDDVQIKVNKSSFIITEYLLLGLEKKEKHYPLEKTIINFSTNGKYAIANEFLFVPPTYDAAIVRFMFENAKQITTKITSGTSLSVLEFEDISRLPNNCLICYLNGYVESQQLLENARDYIKNLEDKTNYIKLKEALRIMRKVKYSVD